jgi:hypothetical protein
MKKVPKKHRPKAGALLPTGPYDLKGVTDKSGK